MKPVGDLRSLHELHEADLPMLVGRVRDLFSKMQETLGDLSPSAPIIVPTQDDPTTTVKRLSWERTVRNKFFPSRFTKDPAWPILLMLYQCRASAQTISVTGLSYSVGLPLATGHRWIEALKHSSYLHTVDSQSDARTTLVVITDFGFENMTAYLQSIDRGTVAS